MFMHNIFQQSLKVMYQTLFAIDSAIIPPPLAFFAHHTHVGAHVHHEELSVNTTVKAASRLISAPLYW